MANTKRAIHLPHLQWEWQGDDAYCHTFHFQFGAITIVINRLGDKARISMYQDTWLQHTAYVTWRGVYTRKAIAARARTATQDYFYTRQ